MADPADLAGDKDAEVSAASLDELLVTDGAGCVDELITDPLLQTEKQQFVHSPQYSKFLSQKQ